MDKTVIISFSSRKVGNCNHIGEFIRSKIANSVLFSFSDFFIHPCGKCRYECFQNREGCPYFGDMECRILDAVYSSDRTIFIVPCYSGYPCSNFFIFNERSLCYFQGLPEVLEKYLNIPKKFIAVSNTDPANLREAFTQHTCGVPEMLTISPKHYGKNSIEGNLMDCAQAQTDIETFVSGE